MDLMLFQPLNPRTGERKKCDKKIELTLTEAASIKIFLASQKSLLPKKLGQIISVAISIKFE